MRSSGWKTSSAGLLDATQQPAEKTPADRDGARFTDECAGSEQVTQVPPPGCPAMDSLPPIMAAR